MNPIAWTNAQWINIGLGVLGVFTFLLLVRYAYFRIHRYLAEKKLTGKFAPQTIRQALRFYLPLRFSTHARQGKKIHQDILHYFLSFGLTPKNFEYTYYLVLGAPGSGKTHFLIQLFYQYRKQLFDKDFQVECFHVSHPDLTKVLRSYPTPEKTVLLLDGLDEDSLALKDLKKRLDNIFLSTTSYAKVIITCRTNFFPKEMEKPSNDEVMHYVGERHTQLCARFYLEPLTDKQIVLGAKSLLSGHKKLLRKKGKLILDQTGHMFRLPLYLDQIPQLLYGDLPYLFRFQIWEEVVRYWIIRTSGGLPSEKIRKEITMDEFLGELAWEMAKNVFNRRGWYVSQATLYELLNKHQASAKGFDPILLRINGHGDIIFSNLLVCAYLLAREIFEGRRNVRLIDAIPLPEVRLFYEEMCWYSYSHSLHINEGEAGYYRTYKDPSKRPLSNLMVEEIQDISRLYLRRYRNLNLRFLRAMKELKALYLIEGEEEDLNEELLDLLPHDKLMLYIENYQGIKAYQPAPKVFAGTGPEDMTAEKIKSYSPYYHLDPGLPIAKFPAEGATKRVVSWFNMDLHKILDKEANLTSISQTSSGQAISEYDLSLGKFEWGLFDKVQIFVFPNKKMNIIFQSSHAPALFEQHLSQVIDRIADLYGEDDQYRSFWSQDDSIQLEESYWTGRSWGWINSDNYAYPIQLFMNEPGLIKMILYNIEVK